jgi:hypothetical protein
MVFWSCQVSWRHGALKNKNLAGSSEGTYLFRDIEKIDGDSPSYIK